MKPGLKVTLAFTGATAFVVGLGMLANPKRWSEMTGLNIPEFHMPSWPKSVAKPQSIKDSELGHAFSAETQPEAETGIWLNPPQGLFNDVPLTDSSGVYGIFHRDGSIAIAVVKDGQPDDGEAGRAADANWIIVAPVANPNSKLREMSDYMKATHFKEHAVLEDVRILPIELMKDKKVQLVTRNGVSTYDFPELNITIAANPKIQPTTLNAGIGQYKRYEGYTTPLGASGLEHQPVVDRR